MATNLLSFRPIGVRPCSASGDRKPDSNRRKNSSSNWWTPIFGWSSDPDYIDSDNSTSDYAAPEKRKEIEPESDLDPKPSRSRFAPGCFTEEKAKQLRLLTNKTSSFHDVMYHSSIASRLASDFPDRSDL